MLKKINIKQKELTPLVCVDKKNTKLVFKGVCVPENTYEFFNPIFKWIDEYSLKPIKEFKFQFELDYFNTSSSRMILELMKRIQKIPNQYIEWLLFEDDEDINEVVNDYNELLGGGIIIKIKQRDFAVS
ncbi:MAG: DUF1987 domain-containing protein [Vicingaceae bacterium]|nr:DUF1987 domain-containing protein [Vicingaceae bacterium]